MAKKTEPLKRQGDGARVVYEELRRIIVNQSLAVGARLPEAAIAKKFSVSRTIVREAIGLLVGDGLVERSSNRGARVCSPDRAEAEDILTMRRELEGIAVAHLAGNLSPTEIERLQAQIEQERTSSDDHAHALEASLRFHTLLAELTKSPTLQRYVSEIIARSTLVFTAQTTSHALGCSHVEHAEIVEALKAGDPERAKARMTQHLLDVERRSRLAPQPAKHFSELGAEVFPVVK